MYYNLVSVTRQYVAYATHDLQTIGSRDAAAERTGMYSQRVCKSCVA